MCDRERERERRERERYVKPAGFGNAVVWLQFTGCTALLSPPRLLLLQPVLEVRKTERNFFKLCKLKKKLKLMKPIL